jgi:aspartyl-tRNA synthetase
MNEIFEKQQRTCDCGALRGSDAGKEVVLMGWVHNVRDVGRAGRFVLLRDRGGITQILFQPEIANDAAETARELSAEDCIAVVGRVEHRGAKNVNAEMATGEIEVHAAAVQILSRAETPPFSIRAGTDAKEELRLRYRYMDLRRPPLARNFMLRSRVCRAVRNHLSDRGFLETETPLMVKYTPGGARNFLVPSRLREGRFYALAESPQIFKQLLMISGFERYFQIVRCFRDEDPRQDRQVEFTQIDLEMSFCTEEDVYRETEGMVQAVWREVLGRQVELPLKRMTYAEAQEKYGTDKPDLRFGLEHHVIGDLCGQCGFKVFEGAAQRGELIKVICVPQGKKRLSRKKIDELTRFVRREEVGPVAGLAWTKADGRCEGGNLRWNGGFAKFIDPAALDAIGARCNAAEQDALLVLAGPARRVHKAADALRRRLARDLDLIAPDAWAFCWVTAFPLFEWSEENEKWVSSHHPFTMPRKADLERLESDPGSVRARAYDLVLNGSEIAGGSIRIHRPELQKRVLTALGISDQEAQDKFGFLMEAFRYGAPPHGGIAAGLDRIMMMLCDTDSIRDVIAFPKTITGVDLMTGAPGTVSPKQLAELKIKSTANPASGDEHETESH